MTRSRAERLSSGLSVFSFCSGFGLLFSGLLSVEWIGKIFGLFSVILFLIGVTLLLLYPDFFTLESKKNLEKQGLDQVYFSMEAPIILPGSTALIWLFTWGNVANWLEPVIAAVILAAALGVLFWRVLDYFQEKPKELIAYVLTMAIALTGILWQVNRILDFAQPEFVRVQVQDIGYSYNGRGPDFYYFVTEINGDTCVIRVRGWQWKELSIGEYVMIEIHSGALGMEYYELAEFWQIHNRK